MKLFSFGSDSKREREKRKKIKKGRQWKAGTSREKSEEYISMQKYKDRKYGDKDMALEKLGDLWRQSDKEGEKQRN